MDRKKIISRKCLCLYSCKPVRRCGSKVFLIAKNILESFEWKTN